ncbi:ankyrin repeat domain-containing protein 13D-like [Bradysia coprophila]|uniref:ankyrin repeat domain-containing protein 13D-like n=1 Tax=Bradysia coprophila TaxID=38358 RepID=UPI00187D9B6F|nr:ankyrin repeat domain-containing protein 13D-like [Bradysia coprophila]
MDVESIEKKYPLHWLVWNNSYEELQEKLKNEAIDLEQLDPRGRTPLMLAVRLSHSQSVKALLAAKCNANAECDGWSVVQEAVSSGDPEILTAILEVRDLQRHIQRVTHVPQLLQKLIEAPDFYIEMKWEFTSWVPLVSRFCPSDVYKVYKRGSNVRIDTTLLGFDYTTWQRGNRSYIFKGQSDSATMIEVNHDAHEVSIEQLKGIEGEITGIPPTRESVSARLNAPVTSNHIDMEKISFERNKSGIWGWRSEKSEDVNGYECKVYAASNVEFITRTRTEHLSESQARLRHSRTPLQNFLGIAEEECASHDASPSEPEPLLSVENYVAGKPVTADEYFSDIDLCGRDIGRPRKMSEKIQRFKATLWLSEEFPIKLQEQVLPILDLMSTMASPHVSKLKDFITMQLPSGFPIKVEIPLFNFLNACVTFGNVFALETPVEHVTNIQEKDRLSCVIDDRCFDIPTNYVNKGGDYRRQLTFEDEDDLLQYAIQQSLIETGSESEQVDIWEALKARRPVTPNNFADDDAQMQRVLQESLYEYLPTSNQTTTTPVDDDLALALQLSVQLSAQEQSQRQQELLREEEMFELALKLSLEEK